ncbi:fasciclin domain-containing protein [uncultured Alsobacter sp.]|uniref:fasciclin domain-containing protein n=1 Tax=uncultured Alsobacter sp. TaxID=1748258 RepID=UPI0025F8896B|nr:fasciclin domain-containing protein [uncultured Alsobacter sp.]
MSFRTLSACAAIAAFCLAVPAQAKPVVVGGAPMFPEKTIVQNAVNSKDHTTLVAAVKAAGLVDTLQGPGPFTVFAPTNKAFAKLPAGTFENLVMPQNKGTLTKVLTYHVVPGRYTAADLMTLVDKSGGEAKLKTAEGETLSVVKGRSGKSLYVQDMQGHSARVTIANVMQSNGVIHVVDTVMMP